MNVAKVKLIFQSTIFQQNKYHTYNNKQTSCYHTSYNIEKRERKNEKTRQGYRKKERQQRSQPTRYRSSIYQLKSQFCQRQQKRFYLRPNFLAISFGSASLCTRIFIVL